MEAWIVYGCVVVVVVGLALIAWSRFRNYRESSRGWRVSNEPMGLRYEEKNEGGRWNSLLIRATLRGRGFGELLIPSESIWNSRQPEWARGRRDEIVARVRNHAPALPLAEEPNQAVEPTAESGRGSP